jgi:hypothetical protein
MTLRKYGNLGSGVLCSWLRAFLVNGAIWGQQGPGKFGLLQKKNNDELKPRDTPQQTAWAACDVEGGGKTALCAPAYVTAH